MSRLRILFAWLLLTAIPMQGFAAASMLLCGMGHQPQSVHMAPAASAMPAGHHDHAAMHGKVASGKSHTCSICASCCNSMALIATEPMLHSEPAPQSAWREPLVQIYNRPSPVPDKPPRA